MNKILITAFALIATLMCGSAHAEIQKMTLRAASSNPEGNLNTVTLQKFCELVEQYSDGRITTKQFYGGVLGDEQTNAKQVRDGELHISTLNPANLSPFASVAGITTLPYLFESVEDAKRLLFNEEFLDEFAEKVIKASNIRPMAWTVGDWCFPSNSKKPIRNIKDIRSLKMRVPPANIIMAAYRSWGVEPHPLAWVETFSGIQQGVVDGQVY